MHTVLQLMLYWGLAFLTLAAALTLLNIFDSLVGNDLTLLTPRQEAVLAGVATLFEAGSLWTLLTYAPAASGRVAIVILIIVGGLYQIAHLTDWAKTDAVMLVIFQAVLVLVLSSLLDGHFVVALTVLAIFGALLALVISLARSLGQ